MNVELRMDGKVIVNLELDMATIISIRHKLETPVLAPGEWRSSPLTVPEARELLTKIDPKSKAFLLELARQGGKLTWGEMRVIFELDRDAEWSSYGRAWGKGITRAVRYITGDKQAKLVWWDDDEWEDDQDPMGPVYVDGPALDALKSFLS